MDHNLALFSSTEIKLVKARLPRSNGRPGGGGVTGTVQGHSAQGSLARGFCSCAELNDPEPPAAVPKTSEGAQQIKYFLEKGKQPHPTKTGM